MLGIDTATVLAGVLRQQCVALYSRVLHATRIELHCDREAQGGSTNGKSPGGMAASIASSSNNNKNPSGDLPPSQSYVPQSKEKLSDLDEAIRAIWEPADAKEIDGILKWAKVEKVNVRPWHDKCCKGGK